MNVNVNLNGMWKRVESERVRERRRAHDLCRRCPIVPCQKGAQTISCRVLRVTPDTNASTMELHWERLGRLFGPLVIIGSLSGLLHLEFEWSLRWAVVAGLFVAVRLQKWALI